jgi:hypothetical protein
MPLRAPAGQASHGLRQHELDASVLLATIQRQIHTILEPPRPAAAAARAGAKAQPGPPPLNGLVVAPEEVVTAVDSIADALEKGTDVSYILCLRPSAREALAKLLPQRANGGANDLDALATLWDDECVKRQLESFRVLEGVLSAARPDVSCRLPYDALAALLGDGRDRAALRPRTEMLLKEKDSIEASMRIADEAIESAQASRTSLAAQRDIFANVSNRMAAIAERLPLIGGLLGKITGARRKDMLVMACVITSCLVFTFLYIVYVKLG